MTNILIKNATVKEINQALLRLQGADSNSGTTTNVTVRSSSSSSGGSSVNLSGVYSKIQTNAKNIASNTSSISLINTKLTEDEKSIKANTTNITKNTNNIASNSSKIGSIIGILSTDLYTLSAGDTTLALKNNYTLTEQEVTVPYATAALNDSDGNAINDTYLKLTGGILTGDLTVNGNIYQNGSSYITHAEHLYSKDDLILTRDGATTGLSSGTYTGIEALLYDGTNNGYLVFDNTGTQLVGDEGSLVPLQARDAEANMTDNKLVYWDATNKILKTSTFPSSGSYLPLTGGTLTGQLTGTTATFTTVNAALNGNQSTASQPLGGYSITDCLLPYAGTEDISSSGSLTAFASGQKTFLGSQYLNPYWYNVISIRHRNGTGDGNAYGLLIYNDMTREGSLQYQQHIGGNWSSQKTILDSSNYTTYTSYYLPLTGGTLSGSLSGTTQQFDSVTTILHPTSFISGWTSLTAGTTYYVKLGSIVWDEGQCQTKFQFRMYGSNVVSSVDVILSDSDSNGNLNITCNTNQFALGYGIQCIGLTSSSGWNTAKDVYAVVIAYATDRYNFTTNVETNNCMSFIAPSPSSTAVTLPYQTSTANRGISNNNYITQPTFVGALTGNATTATTANNGQELYYKGKTTYTNTTTTYEKVVIGKIYPHSDTDILVVLRNNSGYRCKVWLNVNASLTSSVDYINIKGHQDYSSTDFGAYKIGITAGENYATLTMEVACQTSTAVYIDVYAQDKQTQTDGYLALGAFTVQLQATAISQTATYDYEYGISSTGQFIKTLNGDTATFTTLNTTSARKYKKNIKEWKQNALDLIDKVNVVEYKYKSENDSNEKHIGFIADDTDKLLSGEKQDKMRIQDSIGVLIKAVQELKQLYTNIIEAE